MQHAAGFAHVMEQDEGMNQVILEGYIIRVRRNESGGIVIISESGDNVWQVPCEVSGDLLPYCEDAQEMVVPVRITGRVRFEIEEEGSYRAISRMWIEADSVTEIEDAQ